MRQKGKMCQTMTTKKRKKLIANASVQISEANFTVQPERFCLPQQPITSKLHLAGVTAPYLFCFDLA
jgi:hypothetical protein